MSRIESNRNESTFEDSIESNERRFDFSSNDVLFHRRWSNSKTRKSNGDPDLFSLSSIQRVLFSFSTRRTCFGNFSTSINVDFISPSTKRKTKEKNRFAAFSLRVKIFYSARLENPFRFLPEAKKFSKSKQKQKNFLVELHRIGFRKSP